MVVSKFSVAPMMDWTDRHCRFFHRILTRQARLYTEMVTTGALIHGPRARLLAFHPAEHPVALQIGGSEPADLAQCARMAEDAGFDEVNLNIGCPSERVQKGAFGACLMREPDLVGDCVSAMRAAVKIPVTVKCRIGVDDQEPREALFGFVDRVARAGCETFVVHARKAWLKGLSPKDNREIPPLDCPLVYALKQVRPELTVVINGGVTTLDEVHAHLAHVDGVMMGRAAYQSPWVLADVDAVLFGQAPRVLTRVQALEAFTPYVAQELAKCAPLNAMTKHVLGLFNGLPGARAFRRHLSENAVKPGAGVEVIAQALDFVRDSGARAAA
jgi:tRNA-dihydrouridine synthase A